MIVDFLFKSTIAFKETDKNETTSIVIVMQFNLTRKHELY